jgi:hypothetical protein
MNWKEDILKFNLPHAKILYMIYYFFKSGELSYQQKFKLKGKEYFLKLRICNIGKRKDFRNS